MEDEKRGSSPASRGGAGVYIEGELGAFYLLAMLARTEARGMPGARISRVRFQGADLGYALDDLIVHGVGPSGDELLEIQSKREISFSPKDITFQEVAEQIARSSRSDVPEDRHQLAVATQRTSKAISGPYQDVLLWARKSASSVEFFDRLAAKGVASDSMRNFVATFRSNLVAAAVEDSDDAIWRLLRRFAILEFDFESTAPLARTHALSVARQVLADEDVSRAGSLWSDLIEISIATAKSGGSIDRHELRAKLVDRGFRLAGDRDYRPARARLADMARMTLAGIGTAVAGVHLTRLDTVAALDQATGEHRFVELRGGPGVGKSAVLRGAAERVGREAQIIVLDPVSTPAGGWLAFAQALGIPGTANEFLNDLAVSGGAVIVIDSLEMFADLARQRTVNDLLRAASAVEGFTVIATARAGYGDATDSWIADDIAEAFGGIHAVDVGELTNDEAAFLVDTAPELRVLLASGHQAARIVRNLYRLSRLLKAPASADIRTEAALARHWWSSADDAQKDVVRPAQRILADLAENSLAGEPELELRADSAARSHLTSSLTLREVRRDQLGFYHDVLRDWGIGSIIDEDYSRIASLDLSAPVSPRVARGIEFAGRLALEARQECAAWLDLLDRLSLAGAHSSWRRQALLAIVRSEIGFELLGRCSAALLADGAALFAELSRAITAVETVPTADLYATMKIGTEKPIPRSLRTNTTGSGVWLLRWVLQHSKDIPIQAFGAVIDLIEIQLQLLVMVPTLAGPTASMLLNWLRQLDVREAEVTIPTDAAAGRMDSNERRRMIEELRTVALLLSSHAPEDAKAYLREVAVERDSYKVKAIRSMSATLAMVAPAELAALITASLNEEREHQSRCGGGSERTFSHADSDYLPPSPAQPPFLDLLTSSPQHGLALVRELVSAAVEFHSDGAEPGENGYTLVFDDGPHFFPWTDTYFWSRDQAREYSVASGLKALEAWGHDRLDAGEKIDAVLADILGPPGSCAAYLLVAVDLLISHFPKTREALVPFLACPELLAVERFRGGHDQVDHDGRRGVGDEPSGRVTLADLRARPSRRATLEIVLPAYLSDDAATKALRDRLGTAVSTLEQYGEHAGFGDPAFMGAYALNLLDVANWVDVEGGRAYRSPPEEAAHLGRLNGRHNEMTRSSELEARIRLAIDGSEHATPETARDAVAYAGGDLPDDSDTDVLKSRSTRLIATAMLVARDGDDDLLDSHVAWVKDVIARTLFGKSDRSSRSGKLLRFNRHALAILALFHLWIRRQSKSDRDALIGTAARHDCGGVTGFAAALERIVETDPRLFKAAMRVAFSACLWRRPPWGEDEAVQKRFEDERAAATERAVTAEIVWLEGGDEPAWPAFPDERPILRRALRVAVPGPERPEDEAEEPDGVVHGGATIHADAQTTAQWLRLLNGDHAKKLDWGAEIVAAYSDWTATINGLGLPAEAEVDRSASEWNEQFYVLYTAALMDASVERFDSQMKLVTDLPDKSFSKVAETLIHAADVLYFNDATRSPARAVVLRARMVDRTMSLRRWRAFVRSPGDMSIDFDTGGVVAKLLLNTHDPFRHTRSYLVSAVADRLDPLLAAMLPLLPGGPTTFVALCTMNMLLVAPRARHLEFLLTAIEAWFERLPTHAGLWISIGIGRKVVEWFEAAIVEEPGMLGPAHPQRDRIGRVLGRLVAVGVAEAHELEKCVERAAVTGPIVRA